MMHMTLYWGKKVTLLIDSWKTDSWTSYSLSLLACLIVSAFYQYLESRRLHLKVKAITFNTPSNVAGGKYKSGVKFAVLE